MKNLFETVKSEKIGMLRSSVAYDSSHVVLSYDELNYFQVRTGFDMLSIPNSINKRITPILISIGPTCYLYFYVYIISITTTCKIGVLI